MAVPAPYGPVGPRLPVRDAAGAVVCAVSVVGHTSRHDTAPLLAPALPPLRTAVLHDRAQGGVDDAARWGAGAVAGLMTTPLTCEGRPDSMALVTTTDRPLTYWSSA